MPDTLIAQVAVSIEAEHINDLLIADPVRNVVADTFNEYDSAATPPVNTIWRQLINLAPAGTVNIDLQAGTYGINLMRDGFRQLITLRGVSAIQIKLIPLAANPTDELVIAAQGANPWLALFRNFAVAPNPVSAIPMQGNAALTLQTDTPWGVDVFGDPPLHGFMFDLTAPVTNAGIVTVEMTIIGQLV
jgi:hypothetical protein